MALRQRQLAPAGRRVIMAGHPDGSRRVPCRLVLRDSRVTTALIGASRWSQIDDSLGALDNLDFTDDELTAIDRHAVDGGIDLWATSSGQG